MAQIVLSGIAVDPAGSGSHAGHAMYYSEDDDEGEERLTKRRRMGPADSSKYFARKKPWVGLNCFNAEYNLLSSEEDDED